MKELLNAQVSSCLTERQRDALSEWAATMGLPVGKLVRDLIVEAVPHRYYRPATPPPNQLTIMEAEPIEGAFDWDPAVEAWAVPE